MNRKVNNIPGCFYGRLIAALMTVALASVCALSAPQDDPIWIKNQSILAGEFISNNITAAVAHNDRIWIGTDRGLTWSANNGRDWQRADLLTAGRLWAEPEDYAAPGWSDMIRDITRILPMGRNIWVGTRGGLFVGGERNWYLVGSKKGMPPTHIWDIAGNETNLWITSRDGLFFSGDSGVSWRRIELAGEAETPASQLFARAAMSDNHVWLGAVALSQTPGRGFPLTRGNPEGGSWETVWLGGDIEPGISTVRLNMIRTYGENIWAGTSIGLFHSPDEGESWRHMSSAMGMLSNDVFDFLIAGERLWAATANGVCYSEDSGRRWRADRYPRGRTNALAADGVALWVGTDGGLLRRLSDGRYWHSFSSRREARAVAVQEIDGRKRWWVGTTGGLALSTNAGRTWRFYTVADRLPSNVINGIAIDGENVWVATSGGVAHMRGSAEHWQRFGVEDGLLSSNITGIGARKGRVWVSSDRGIATFDSYRGQFRTLRQLMSWEHVAFDGDWVIASTLYWDEDIFEQHTRNNIEPMRAPMYRFYRWHERWGAWEDMQVEGYTGGEVFSLAIHGGVFWIVSEDGLYRSLNRGETWNRYGSETLWGPAARCIAPFPDGGLMVQSALIDPPSPWGIWSITAGDGKEWSTLRPRLPAFVNQAASDGKKIICAAEDGVYVLERATNELLNPGRPGWRNFHRMALLAAFYTRGDFQAVVEFDPWSVHGTAYWTAPKGPGPLIQRTMPLADVAFPRHIEPAERIAGPVGEFIEAISAQPQAVWFGSEMGATSYDRAGRWSFQPFSQDGLRGTRVMAIARFENEVWFGTDAGCSVMNIDTGEWRQVGPAGLLMPGGTVTALAPQKDQIWIGTSNGLFRYRDGQVSSAVRGIEVNSAVAGEYAVCAGSDRGLYIVDNGGAVRQRLVPENSRLPANRVEMVILDGTDLWAGSGGAFVRLDVVTRIADERRAPSPSARGPEGVLVVINENSEGSIRVGEYYAEARGIPPENICRISAPLDETISRAVYEIEIRTPIIRHMLKHGISQRISFIATTYGVPLRIAPERDIPDEAESRNTTRASVDSELTLLGRSHPIAGPLPNRYLRRDEPFDSTVFGMYLVSRLDGPTPEDAMALVDRAMMTENDKLYGAKGMGYFETGGHDHARHIKIIDAIKANYRDLDRQLRIGGRVTLAGRLDDDDRPRPAFMYFGWRGIDEPAPSMNWVPGGAGIFLDPLSAAGMRDDSRPVARAVADGATVAIGNAFNPSPAAWSGVERLVSRIHAGYYWAEAAAMSLRYISWDHVVIGDPLYRPLP